MVERASDLEFIDVVFDGPPSAVAGRFVEVEDKDKKSVSCGRWIDRGDGFYVLRIYAVDIIAVHNA